MEQKESKKAERSAQPQVVPAKQKELMKKKFERTEGQECRECIGRIPYATLIATVLCCVGVGVFCGTTYRGSTLCFRMFQDVFNIRLWWLEPFHLIFMIVGGAMGVLGLILLLWGCLATGETRYSVYRAHRARLGGRVCGAVFMTLVYILNIVWLLIFASMTLLTTVFSFFWSICSSRHVTNVDHCIDFTQFDYLFPADMPADKLKICNPGDKKLFCKDYVESAEVMFVLATVSCIFVILSLVHYLMCLSANYAHIKESEKFRDLEEIQRLKDSEMTSLTKDRF